MSTNAQTRGECSDAHEKMAHPSKTHSRVLLEETAGLQSEEEEQEFPYLPIACRKVLERSCRALQSGWVGALCQECQVRLHHRRVPEHLHPFRRLGKSWNRSNSIPLRKECRFVTGQNLYIVIQGRTLLVKLRPLPP